MWSPGKHAIGVLIVWGLTLFSSAAQREIQKHPTGENVTGNEARVASQTLTPDDGLVVIAGALDSSVHVRAKRDCSHLVHAIYAHAGFPFERVVHPQPGDLVCLAWARWDRDQSLREGLLQRNALWTRHRHF